MKKSLFTLLLTIATVLACIFGFSACGEEQSGISFNTFTVDGTNVYGKVSNDTAEFSFLDEVTVTGKSKFVVSLDKNGMQTVVTKTVTLHEGDNVVYIFEMVDDEVCNTYTVTVRRRPMYRVTFDTNGGTAIEKQAIEEDRLATEPESPTKAGCTFTGWDYDFTQPITQNTKITAQFAVKEEMSNFDFTSTVTTCSITGVKDKTVTEIIVPDYVTAIANGAFSGCSSLESITLPFVGATKDGTENTHLGYIFGASNGSYNGDYVPTSLKKVTITSATSIGDYAFFGCTSLTDITVSENNTAYRSIEGNLYSKDGTTLIQYAVGKTATKFTVPDGVTSIGERAFYNCDSLTGVTIPDSVTNIGWDAFWGCDNLTSVTLGNSVASIGEGAFWDCSGLTSVTIPDSVTSIGERAFYNTAYYKNEANWEDGLLYLGKYLIQARTSISGAYTVKDGTLLIAPFAFADCTKLTSITIPDSVKAIGEGAFTFCTKLTSVTIPDGVTSIGEYAFCACDNLTSITIPDSVTSIGDSAFDGCSSLTSVTIPDSVTSIGDFAFAFCTGLTSITIPDSVTNIGDSAFESCDRLKSVVIGNSVTSIGWYSFYGCWNLTSVVIGDSVTNIDEWAFESCNSLISITVSENNTAYQSIEGNLYSKDGTTLIRYAVGKTATVFTVPDSVTTIGKCAFCDCDNLTNIIIPESITSIGVESFDGGSPKIFYYKGTAEEWSKITNDEFTHKFVCYYSETHPTDDGNDYWYYDENGNPAIW